MNYTHLEHLFKQPIAAWFYGHTHANWELLVKSEYEKPKEIASEESFDLDDEDDLPQLPETNETSSKSPGNPPKPPENDDDLPQLPAETDEKKSESSNEMSALETSLEMAHLQKQRKNSDTLLEKSKKGAGEMFTIGSVVGKNVTSLALLEDIFLLLGWSVAHAKGSHDLLASNKDEEEEEEKEQKEKEEDKDWYVWVASNQQGYLHQDISPG